jgi:hypothetical protein
MIRGGVLALLPGVLVACSSAEPAPSRGTYTVQFPSTAAAVATDFVQVLVFDVPDPNARAGLCEELITARLTAPGSLEPSVSPPPTNICAMRAAQRPITIPYGERALLAIAQRRDANEQPQDFMIGCAIMRIGDGDAPLPIPVRLVSVNVPVPPTACASVGEFCERSCQ